METGRQGFAFLLSTVFPVLSISRMHQAGGRSQLVRTSVKSVTNSGLRAVPKAVLEGMGGPQDDVLPAAWPGTYLFPYLPLGEHTLGTKRK